MRDHFHEWRIFATFKLLVLAEKISAWAASDFKRLILSRSQKKVSRMERERGLG